MTKKHSYVSLLGLNGVTEAFVRAAISPTQQYRLNVLLIAFSIVHVLACALLLRSSLASVGLVYANCLGMLLRLAYSVWFIRGFLPEFSWRSVLPPLPVVVVLILARFGLSFVSPLLCSTGMTRSWSASLPAPTCWGLAVGAALICVLVAILEFAFDRTWIGELRELWKGKTAAKTD
jgi:oligosaccharide translocation protein RFT1